MKQHSFCRNGKRYVRIDKRKARRMISEGELVLVNPCRVHPFAAWHSAITLTDYPSSDDFDKVIDRYEYYNCNNEVGRYCSYYIEEREHESDGVTANERRP